MVKNNFISIGLLVVAIFMSYVTYQSYKINIANGGHPFATIIIGGFVIVAFVFIAIKNYLAK